VRDPGTRRAGVATLGISAVFGTGASDDRHDLRLPPRAFDHGQKNSCPLMSHGPSVAHFPLSIRGQTRSIYGSSRGSSVAIVSPGVSCVSVTNGATGAGIARHTAARISGEPD